MKKSRWVFCVVLLGCAPVQLDTETNSPGPYDNLTQLRMSAPNYTQIFAKQNVFTGAETTWSDLHDSVDQQFQAQSAALETAWGLSGKVLEVAFYLNVVANLWGLGDVRDADGTYFAPSCVLENRYITAAQGVPVPGTNHYRLLQATPRDFLQSPLGCCDDYAMVLYILLKLAGYEPTQVGTLDHIYVQVPIDGEDYIVDPTFNFMTKMNNAQFLHQPLDQEVVYYVFTYVSANPMHPNFRHRNGQRQSAYLLNRGRVDIFPPQDYPRHNQFDLWISKNAVGYN